MSKHLLVLLVLVFTFALAFRTMDDYHDLFFNWMQKYNKRYHGNDFDDKFKTFVKNYESIEQHNMNSANTWQQECNQFCDTSYDEFKNMYNLDSTTAPQLCSATAMNTRGRTVRRQANDLPVSVDWRTKNIITPVKNQGRCGSCWTFSTTGAMESHYALKSGVLVSMSEQQLLDCAGAFDNHGCNGGLPSHAFEYIRYAGGMVSEAAYPYQAVASSICKLNLQYVVARTRGSVNITEGDELEMQQAVANNGPVSMAYQVVADFRFYKSGVYSSTVCKNDTMSVNHAVLAVGYGTTPQNEPYWIVKNSWGPLWGNAGYFLIARNKNMCGLATCSSFPDMA